MLGEATWCPRGQAPIAFSESKGPQHRTESGADAFPVGIPQSTSLRMDAKPSVVGMDRYENGIQRSTQDRLDPECEHLEERMGACAKCVGPCPRSTREFGGGRAGRVLNRSLC